MDIAQFRIMLAVHGADFARWDGADPQAAQTFLAESEEAKILYGQARALDEALALCRTEGPDPALLDRVMNQIAAERDSANVLPFRKPQKPPGRPALQTGRARGLVALAVAAAAVLFVTTLIQAPPDVPQNPPFAKLVETRTDAAAGVDVLLAELDTLAEDSMEDQEVMGLFPVVASSHTAAPDIGLFLDEILTPAQPAVPQNDNRDLWDLFMQADTMEL